MDRKSEKNRLDTIVGSNIRQERKARKLSRDELASMLKITNSHLGLIERGKRGANVVIVSMLSDVFGISIDDLFKSPRQDKHSANENLSAIAQENLSILQSMILGLNDSELELTIHMLKGIIAMNQAQKDKKE